MATAPAAIGDGVDPARKLVSSDWAATMTSSSSTETTASTAFAS